MDSPTGDRRHIHRGAGSNQQIGLNRQILALAVPALGALIAEPVFVLIDSVMIGHLGTGQLAGLSLASTLLQTMVGIFVFLAYATTASTARRIGAGDRAGAITAGVNGMWLALGIGVVVAVALSLNASRLVTAFGAGPEVAPHAADYLAAAAPGIPGMLVVLAAMGTLRGLLDTRTPLIVAGLGAGLNAALNAVFIYGLDMGVTGSGLGTAITQTLMAAALVAVVFRGSRHLQISLRPTGVGLWHNARAGIPLFLRTMSLWVAILATIGVATSLGAVALAGHQIVNALWGFTAFALDALAIAAQALVGRGLGARDVTGVRRVMRRSLQWGTGAGAVLGLVIAVGGWWITVLFTTDPAVRRAAAAAFVITGVLLPIAGWVFVLDGVLIGAGDGRYLAWAGLINIAIYLPVVAAVWLWAPRGGAGLAWLWAGFAGGFMAARALTTGWRIRGDAWMVTGV